MYRYLSDLIALNILKKTSPQFGAGFKISFQMLRQDTSQEECDT